MIGHMKTWRPLGVMRTQQLPLPTPRPFSSRLALDNPYRGNDAPYSLAPTSIAVVFLILLSDIPLFDEKRSENLMHEKSRSITVVKIIVSDGRSEGCHEQSSQ